MQRWWVLCRWQAERTRWEEWWRWATVAAFSLNPASTLNLTW